MAFFRKKATHGGIALDVNSGVIINAPINGNVMQVSGRDLELYDLQLPWREQPRPTVEWLLSWKGRLTDFVGREEEFSEICAWTKSNQKIGARLIHGSAGSGKTRLAGEVAEKLIHEHGWAAGFIDPERSAAYRAGEQGTLLIVDYPEEKRSTVLELLGAMGRMEEPGKPLRVLLISRQSPEQWQETIAAAHCMESMDSPLELGSLMGESPWALFSAAWTRARDVLEQPNMVSPITAERFMQWLADNPLHQRPLFILAYAVQLAFDPDNPALQGREIFHYLTLREKGRWQNQAKEAGMEPHTLLRLKGLAFISGGLSPKQLRALARNKSLALNLPSEGKVVDLVRSTGELISDNLPAVEPDLLAASVLHVVLAHEEQAGTWIWSVLDFADSLESALQRLVRLAYDLEYTLELSWPIELLATEVNEKVDRCLRLDSCLSKSIETLARPSWVTPDLLLPLWVAVFRTLANATGDEAEQGRHLNNLSTRLARLGRRNEALQASQRAVEIYQPLAAHNAGLASSLNNLSARLVESGDRAGAITAIKRSLIIYERLTEKESGIYEPYLTQGLSNLSSLLAAEECHSEALLKSRQAVEIYDRLAMRNPAIYRPHLAISLNQLSTRLGDCEDALTHVRRAVEIQKQLAKQNPAAYESELADSYKNLSLRLSESGHFAGALEAIESALEIFERVARLNPWTYSQGLVSSFDVQLKLLREHEDQNAVLAATQRAAAVYLRFVKHSRTVYHEELTNILNSLNNVALELRELGDSASALTAIKSVVEIYDHLAMLNPAFYEPRLADILTNLQQLCQPLDPALALTAIKRAVVIKERLADQDPVTHEPFLAASLSNLAQALLAEDDCKAALAAIERAVNILNRLSKESPAKYEPQLACFLSNLSVCLSRTGNRSRAVMSIERAVEILERHAIANPAFYEAQLLAMLDDLASKLRKAGRDREADTTVRRATQIRNRLKK